jgi:methyltransferase (TIGR00027 family)
VEEGDQHVEMWKHAGREARMPRKRIETTTSRTAQMTCMSRAVSSLEKDACYRGDDHIAVLLLPKLFRLLIQIPFFRWLCRRVIAPKGIYEYVIARTKFIDAVFKQALANRFSQILLFGAGFDTRALRFQAEAASARIFELDAPLTQSAKINQYRKRGLCVPDNVRFVPIDFDKQSLPVKLEEAGLRRQGRTLFVLEGLLMYLRPESVDTTFRLIREFAEKGSEIVFDYVYASVLRHENLYYGEEDIAGTVAKAGEQWHFGIEKGQIARFLASYDLGLLDHKDAGGLEEMYFKEATGGIAGRINGTHCIVRAVRV